MLSRLCKATAWIRGVSARLELTQNSHKIPHASKAVNACVGPSGLEQGFRDLILDASKRIQHLVPLIGSAATTQVCLKQSGAVATFTAEQTRKAGRRWGSARDDALSCKAFLRLPDARHRVTFLSRVTTVSPPPATFSDREHLSSGSFYSSNFYFTHSLLQRGWFWSFPRENEN